MFARWFAGQLACPRGLFGTCFLARMWNRRNAALSDVAYDALAPVAGDRILEIGFGGGYLLGRLAGVVPDGRLTGVDASSAMVWRARRQFRHLLTAGRLDLRCAPVEALPFAAAAFAKVCSVNSLFYWNDPARGLAECARVLEPGGRLVLCLTCPASLAKRDFTRHGLKLFEPHEIEGLLSAAGLAELRTTRHADRHREFFCTVGTKLRDASMAREGAAQASGATMLACHVDL
jgi:SAM-dependent methyltransferase